MVLHLLAVVLVLLLLAAACVLVAFTKRRAFIFARNASLRSCSSKTVTIGFFHPYANGGGGGERVLYCALLALLQHYQNTEVHVHLVLYAGDDGLSATELVERAAEAFNLAELKTLHVARQVTLVPLPRRELLDPRRYPRCTLVWQSVAHMRLALEAIEQSSKLDVYPQVWIDTTGCPFAYVVARLLYACTVVAYVHYPMISTDMIAKVQQRDATFNNEAAIATSAARSTAKYMYYRAFAVAYSVVGTWCTDVVLVNSTWTRDHIKQLWNTVPLIVYPPCGSMREYTAFRLDHRELVALSVAQFRPEKNHLLQLEAFHVLLHKYAEPMTTKYRRFRLVLLGSCRNRDDTARVERLKEQARALGIADRVDFVVNATFAELKRYLAQSSIGVHTMYNEHFGISNVEMMAAGVLVVANNSGGPKADIVKPGTARLALTADEYADEIFSLLEMSRGDAIEMRSRARTSSLRFSDEAFGEQFVAAIRDVLASI